MSTDAEIQEVYLTDIAENYKVLRSRRDWMLNGWLEGMSVYNMNLLSEEDLKLLNNIRE